MQTDDIADKSQQVKEKAQEWQERATAQAQEARETAQAYVRENPWRSLAIAAGVGCVVGFLAAKLTD